MKCRIHIATQGWLPQDPYIPSHLKIDSNRHRWISKVKTVVGSTLLLIGLFALLLSSMAIQQTHEIHSDSYTLEPNQKSSDVGTSGGHFSFDPFYNMHSFEGQIIVEGKNVEFKVVSREPAVITCDNNGKKINQTVYFRDSETHEVLSTTVDGTYTFNLPANGDYSYDYVIENTGNQRANINFQLNETQITVSRLIPGVIALLVTALPGAILIVSGRRSRKATFQMPPK
ncbi:MAG: hypothetical protein ACQCN3_12320 [Candidatus Bathyarchaeia archaeon]|jgi:hypothetical protein